jgi:hypothetical protein
LTRKLSVSLCVFVRRFTRVRPGAAERLGRAQTSSDAWAHVQHVDDEFVVTAKRRFGQQHDAGGQVVQLGLQVVGRSRNSLTWPSVRSTVPSIRSIAPCVTPRPCGLQQDEGGADACRQSTGSAISCASPTK